jgi:DNA-binding response OmpR family regulator
VPLIEAHLPIAAPKAERIGTGRRVVLQDLMLPDADGFELVGELRELARGADVSILAFSGFVSEFDEGRVSSVGFDDIIAKPISPSRLVPLIEAHLPIAALAKDRRCVNPGFGPDWD